jgi:limonene-1,2-epoxide hydrolase
MNSTIPPTRRGLISRRFAIGAGLALSAAVSTAQAAKTPSPWDVALAIITDWRERKIDAVLARVDPNIIWHYHVGAHPPILGRDAMRSFLEAMLTRVSDNHWRVFKHAVTGDSVLMEGVDDFRDAAGTRIPVAYMGIMTVKNGLVTEWRDYFDGQFVERLKHGEALNDSLQSLLKRPALPRD